MIEFAGIMRTALEQTIATCQTINEKIIHQLIIKFLNNYGRLGGSQPMFSVEEIVFVCGYSGRFIADQKFTLI